MCTCSNICSRLSLYLHLKGILTNCNSTQNLLPRNSQLVDNSAPLVKNAKHQLDDNSSSCSSPTYVQTTALQSACTFAIQQLQNRLLNLLILPSTRNTSMHANCTVYIICMYVRTYVRTYVRMCTFMTQWFLV